MIIKNARVFTEEGIIENGFVQIAGQKIIVIGDMANFASNSDDIIIDANKQNLIPGFIDQHIHGAETHDAMDGTFEAIDGISKALTKEGTTSFLSTTMTESKEKINKALSNIADYIENHDAPGQSQVLGIHLEGPFISPDYIGAQNPAYVLKPNISDLEEFQASSRNNISKLTYAVEDSSFEFTKYLKDNNIIASAGHCGANVSTISEHIPYGLRSVTHLYNAMSPLRHRNPGVVAAGFSFEELYIEMICDGIHVEKEMMDLTFKLKGADKVMVITDSMRAKGCVDGEYDLGGQTVIKKGMEARLANGALAGSVAKMIDSARLLKNVTGCTMEQIIRMTSTNAARLLGILDKKGSIAVGKDADLIIVDDELNLISCICRGMEA